MAKSVRYLIIGLVVFVIASGTLAVLCYLESDEKAVIDGQIGLLTPQIIAFNNRYNQLPQIQKEKDELERHFANFVAYLPAKSDLDEHNLPRLLSDFVRQASCVSGATEFFDGDAQGIGGSGYRDFSRKIVRTTISGNFNQVRDFMDIIETHQQLMQIDSFSMAPTGSDIDNARELRVQVDISLFYYDRKSR